MRSIGFYWADSMRKVGGCRTVREGADTKQAKGVDMSEDEKGAYRVGVALLPLLRRCLSLNRELNKPVAGIVGYCQFLLDDKNRLQPEQRLSVDEIRDCAIKIQTILEEIAAEKANLAKEVDLGTFEEAATKTTEFKVTD